MHTNTDKTDEKEALMKDKTFFDPAISIEEREKIAKELLERDKKQFTVALTDDKYNSYTEVMKDTLSTNQNVRILFKFYRPPAVIVKVKDGDAEKLAKFTQNIVSLKKKGKVIDIMGAVKKIYNSILDDVKLTESKESLIQFFAKKHKGINKISTEINILSEVVVKTDRNKLKTVVLFNRFVVFVYHKIKFNDGLSTIPVMSDSIRVNVSKNGQYEVLKDEGRFPVMIDQLKYVNKVFTMVKDVVDIEELKEFALKYLPKKFNFKIRRYLYDPLKPLPKNRGFKVLKIGPNEYYKINGNFTREEFKAIEDLFSDIIDTEIDQNPTVYSKWHISL